MKSCTTTIHLRGEDARNFMKAVAAERASADEGREDKKHVPILIAMEAAQRELLARVERAEADKAELVEALEQLLMAYEMILPGVAKISIPDYGLMNNAPCKASAALARVKDAP